MLGEALVLDPGQEGEILMTRMTEHDSAATGHLSIILRLRNSKVRGTRATRRLKREDTVDSRNITKITDIQTDRGFPSSIGSYKAAWIVLNHSYF